MEKSELDRLRRELDNFIKDHKPEPAYAKELAELHDDYLAISRKAYRHDWTLPEILRLWQQPYQDVENKNLRLEISRAYLDAISDPVLLIDYWLAIIFPGLRLLLLQRLGALLVTRQNLALVWQLWQLTPPQTPLRSVVVRELVQRIDACLASPEPEQTDVDYQWLVQFISWLNRQPLSVISELEPSLVQALKNKALAWQQTLFLRQ